MKMKTLRKEFCASYSDPLVRTSARPEGVTSGQRSTSCYAVTLVPVSRNSCNTFTIWSHEGSTRRGKVRVPSVLLRTSPKILKPDNWFYKRKYDDPPLIHIVPISLPRYLGLMTVILLYYKGQTEPSN